MAFEQRPRSSTLMLLAGRSTKAAKVGTFGAFARRIGIQPSQLFTCRRDARAERHCRSGHSSSVAGAVIEIAIGEVVVRAGMDVDEAHLQRVIRAFRSA